MPLIRIGGTGVATVGHAGSGAVEQPEAARLCKSVGVWRYRQVVGLELGIRLRGSVGDLDAQRVLRDLNHLVTLLGLLEDAQLRKDRQPASRSTWGFSALGLGSVDAVIAALEPRGGASFEVLDHLPELFVAGFADVESAARVPEGWSTHALREAELATRRLGTDAARAMVLTLLVDGQQQRTVEVTHRASTNARTAMKARFNSLGSVIGTLDSVSVHRRKRAGLWTTRGGRRVEVAFEAEQLDDVASLLGQHIEVWGRLSRNADDQVLSVQARRFERLRRPEEGRRLSELRGIAPNLTGGVRVDQYLERLRGTS